MTLELFTGGFVSTNSYLLEKDGTTLLVDAPAGVFQWLQQRDLSPDYLLITHQHFDHVEDAHLFQCPIFGYAEFARNLVMDDLARGWGLPVTVEQFTVAQELAGEEELVLGRFEFELLHVPGHSPDSLVYSLPQEGIALVGDTLFRQGVGRTDLPGGDGKLLLDGIREKLLTLSGETKLLPGHGPRTTPADELTNPYLS